MLKAKMINSISKPNENFNDLASEPNIMMDAVRKEKQPEEHPIHGPGQYRVAF